MIIVHLPEAVSLYFKWKCLEEDTVAVPAQLASFFHYQPWSVNELAVWQGYLDDIVIWLWVNCVNCLMNWLFTSVFSHSLVCYPAHHICWVQIHRMSPSVAYIDYDGRLAALNMESHMLWLFHFNISAYKFLFGLLSFCAKNFFLFQSNFCCICIGSKPIITELILISF